MPLITLKLREFGIDPRPVLREVDRAKRKVLGRQGGYLRKVARSSIKRKGKARLKRGEEMDTSGPLTRRQLNIWQESQQRQASPAGEPPHTHTGFIKGDIYYAVDAAADSVAIGAHKFPWLNELLEHGGQTRRQVWLHRPSGRTFLFHRGPGGKSGRGRRAGVWQFLRVITVTYPERSFMRRALERSKDRLASFWEGAVRK